MSEFVFTYGTLVYDDVMQAVTGTRFVSEAAVLHGFRRVRVRGAVYPALVPSRRDSVCGRLYRDVDDRALTLLDRFEGDLYDRRVVSVTRPDGSQVRAQAYLVPGARRSRLTTHAWDQDRFEREHLAAYLASCRAFHRSQAAPGGIPP